MRGKVPVEQLLFDPEIERITHKKLNENKKKETKSQKVRSIRVFNQTTRNNGLSQQ